jgi:hypothetical protein
MDCISITVLPDGTIKTDNDGISMPNHQNAEAFLRDIGRLAGGKTTVKMKGTHQHLHHALHVHASDGHTHTH